MAELVSQETRELLLGTWIGVSLVAEILIHRELICRDDLVCVLEQAMARAQGGRRTAIAGMWLLIESGFGLGDSAPDY